jgi:hypothetical protein
LEEEGVRDVKRATRGIGGLSLKAGAGTIMAVQVAYNNLQQKQLKKEEVSND